MPILFEAVRVASIVLLKMVTDTSVRSLNFMKTNCILNYIVFSFLDWRVFTNKWKSQPFVRALTTIARISF